MKSTTLVFFLLALIAPASADTLWDNGLRVPSNGGYCDDCFTNGQFVYDNFLITSEARLTAFTFMSGTVTVLSGGILQDYRTTDWFLFKELPQGDGSNAIASGEVTASLTQTGNFQSEPLYQTRVSTPEIVLGVGTYWIAFRNNSLDGQTISYALTSQTSPLPGGGGVLYQGASDGIPEEFAFTIEGSVLPTETPEPTTFMLFGSSLISLFLTKTRFAKQGHA